MSVMALSAERVRLERCEEMRGSRVLSLEHEQDGQGSTQLRAERLEAFSRPTPCRTPIINLKDSPIVCLHPSLWHMIRHEGHSYFELCVHRLSISSCRVDYVAGH
jgi:hypothetical protein